VLYESIEALRRALRSAGVTPEQLHAVLLVGGSSRMPIVSQLVGAELGRPVAVDAHPKHAIALGAAWVASGAGAASRAVEGGTAPAAGGIAPRRPPEPLQPLAPLAPPDPLQPLRFRPLRASRTTLLPTKARRLVPETH
jgi:sugar (pentulose or hexulose) kinase